MTEQEREEIKKSRQACLDWYRQNLTKDQLAFVRKFGAVAESDESWRLIPSNQIIGMELCEVAAEHFGEHYMKEPWN